MACSMHYLKIKNFDLKFKIAFSLFCVYTLVANFHNLIFLLLIINNF